MSGSGAEPNEKLNNLVLYRLLNPAVHSAINLKWLMGFISKGNFGQRLKPLGHLLPGECSGPGRDSSAGQGRPVSGRLAD